MPLRVYQLNNGPTGPSTLSKHYGRYGKMLWLVAAPDAATAVALAKARTWSADGAAGIVASSGDASEAPWRLWDGRAVRAQPFRHRQSLRQGWHRAVV